MFRVRDSGREYKREYNSRLGYAVDDTCGAIKFVFSGRCPITPEYGPILNKVFDYVGGAITVLLSPILVSVSYIDSFNKLEKVDDPNENPAPLDLID